MEKLPQIEYLFDRLHQFVFSKDNTLPTSGKIPTTLWPDSPKGLQFIFDLDFSINSKDLYEYKESLELRELTWIYNYRAAYYQPLSFCADTIYFLSDNRLPMQEDSLALIDSSQFSEFTKQLSRRHIEACHLKCTGKFATAVHGLQYLIDFHKKQKLEFVLITFEAKSVEEDKSCQFYIKNQPNGKIDPEELEKLENNLIGRSIKKIYFDVINGPSIEVADFNINSPDSSCYNYSIDYTKRIRYQIDLEGLELFDDFLLQEFTDPTQLFKDLYSLLFLSGSENLDSDTACKLTHTDKLKAELKNRLELVDYSFKSSQDYNFNNTFGFISQLVPDHGMFNGVSYYDNTTMTNLGALCFFNPGRNINFFKEIYQIGHKLGLGNHLLDSDIDSDVLSPRTKNYLTPSSLDQEHYIKSPVNYVRLKHILTAEFIKAHKDLGLKPKTTKIFTDQNLLKELLTVEFCEKDLLSCSLYALLTNLANGEKDFSDQVYQEFRKEFTRLFGINFAQEFIDKFNVETLLKNYKICINLAQAYQKIDSESNKSKSSPQEITNLLKLIANPKQELTVELIRNQADIFKPLHKVCEADSSSQVYTLKDFKRHYRLNQQDAFWTSLYHYNPQGLKNLCELELSPANIINIPMDYAGLLEEPIIASLPFEQKYLGSWGNYQIDSDNPVFVQENIKFNRKLYPIEIPYVINRYNLHCVNKFWKNYLTNFYLLVNNFQVNENITLFTNEDFCCDDLMFSSKGLTSKYIKHLEDLNKGLNSVKFTGFDEVVKDQPFIEMELIDSVKKLKPMELFIENKHLFEIFTAQKPELVLDLLNYYHQLLHGELILRSISFEQKNPKYQVPDVNKLVYAPPLLNQEYLDKDFAWEKYLLNKEFLMEVPKAPFRTALLDLLERIYKPYEKSIFLKFYGYYLQFVSFWLAQTYNHKVNSYSFSNYYASAKAIRNFEVNLDSTMFIASNNGNAIQVEIDHLGNNGLMGDQIYNPGDSLKYKCYMSSLVPRYSYQYNQLYFKAIAPELKPYLYLLLIQQLEQEILVTKKGLNELLKSTQLKAK